MCEYEWSYDNARGSKVFTVMFGSVESWSAESQGHGYDMVCRFMDRELVSNG